MKKGALFLNCAVFGALIRPDEQPWSLISSSAALNNNKSREIIGKSAERPRNLNCALLRSPSLILICASSFFQTLGWLVPFTYLAGIADLIRGYIIFIITLTLGSSWRTEWSVKRIGFLPPVLGRNFGHFRADLRRMAG